MKFKLYHDFKKKKWLNPANLVDTGKNFQFNLLETISGSSSSDFHMHAEHLMSKTAI